MRLLGSVRSPEAQARKTAVDGHQAGVVEVHGPDEPPILVTKPVTEPDRQDLGAELTVNIPFGGPSPEPVKLGVGVPDKPLTLGQQIAADEKVEHGGAVDAQMLKEELRDVDNPDVAG